MKVSDKDVSSMSETNWEELYQDNDCPWNKGTPCPGLVEWLESNRMTGTVVVPGCGFGYDAYAISQANPEAHVIGLDIAPSAIKKAQEMHNSSNLEFHLSDLFEENDKLDNKVDWIWEHTFFCAIPMARRSDYVKSVIRLLKPKTGTLLGIFFLNPHMEPGEDGPPHGTSLDELDSLFTPYFEIEKTWAPKEFYDTRIDRERMRLMGIK